MALASRASVALTIVPRCSKYLSQKSTFPRHDSIKLEVNGARLVYTVEVLREIQRCILYWAGKRFLNDEK